MEVTVFAVSRSEVSSACDLVKDSCRLCMARNTTMKPLFDKGIDNIVEMIRFCTGVEFTKEADLPSQICDSCHEDLSVAHEFKKLCLSADQTFRKYMAFNRTKLNKNSTCSESVQGLAPLSKDKNIHSNVSDSDGYNNFEMVIEAETVKEELLEEQNENDSTVSDGDDYNNYEMVIEGETVKEEMSEEQKQNDRYHKQREINRKHPAIKSIGDDLLNLNADFKITENKENIDHADNYIIENTKTSETPDVTNKTSIKENASIKEETDKNFKKIQLQLDMIFDLLRSNKCDSGASTSIDNKIDEMIAQSSIEFPINSVQQLKLLEDKLIDVEFEKALIQKISNMCGTSGTQKISKVGLQIAGSLFTDKLLYQLTWKGIKGCTKVPFITYIKIRHLVFKIIQLADSSCSVKDSDSFLQNSAIKHSGQRIKRKSSEVKISNPKKKKIETEKKNTTENEKDPSSNNLKTIHNSDQEIQAEEINENVQDGGHGLDDKKNKIDDIPDTRKTTKTVTVLSDVKINNKMINLKHETKMMNIIYDDILASQVFNRK